MSCEVDLSIALLGNAHSVAMVLSDAHAVTMVVVSASVTPLMVRLELTSVLVLVLRMDTLYLLRFSWGCISCPFTIQVTLGLPLLAWTWTAKRTLWCTVTVASGRRATNWTTGGITISTSVRKSLIPVNWLYVLNSNVKC